MFRLSQLTSTVGGMANAVCHQCPEARLGALETAKEAADSKDLAVHCAHVWLMLAILTDALTLWTGEVERGTAFH
jgi:hypothetical protein